MRVAIYIRVSTSEQADSGLGLDDQEAKCRAYAALYGHIVTGVYRDAGESAKSLSRPRLGEALAALAAGEAQGLIVAKLDRLTRSVRDLGELLATTFAPGHSSLISVGETLDTSSAAGRLMVHILASVSQWEREAIGERTKAALQQKKARGEATGGHVPYGYSKTADGRLVLNERETAAQSRARALRAEGKTLRSIGLQLAEEGHAPRSGSVWGVGSIQRLVGEHAKAALNPPHPPVIGPLAPHPCQGAFLIGELFIRGVGPTVTCSLSASRSRSECESHPHRRCFNFKLRLPRARGTPKNSRSRSIDRTTGITLFCRCHCKHGIANRSR